jgi:hypothetical protein
MEAPNPKDIKEEKVDWEEHGRRYPTQKKINYKERKLVKPKDGLMLEVGQCITDIPLDQRHRYMWLVPDEKKDHPMYKEKDWGDRVVRECEEKKCCEEREKKKKEQDREKNDKDKDDKIEMLIKYVADLGKQVNELTKQMKK